VLQRDDATAIPFLNWSA